MSYRAKAKYKDNKIHIKTDFGFKEMVKSLNHRKWDAKNRCWVAKVTTATAESLLSWHRQQLIEMDDQLVQVLEAKLEKDEKPQRPFPYNYPYLTEPFDKQKEAINFLYARDYWALFAEMGCGKSKMIIDTWSAHYIAGRIDGLVVISRVSIREGWLSEMEKHCPLSKVNMLSLESKKSATKKTKYLKAPFFVSVGCESLSGRLAGGQVYDALLDLVKSRRCMIVVDESHYVKSHKSNRTKNATELASHCPIRGIMTGTPTPKNILDLYAPFELLDPDIMGYPSFWRFQLTHAIMGGYGGKQVLGFRDVDSIKAKIDPHTFRMSRKEVVSLPPLIRKPIEMTLTPEMRKAYNKMKTDKELIMEEEGIEILPRAEMVAVYMKLRALSSGYVTDDEKKVHWIVPPSSTPKMKELADIMINTDEKRIIWVNTHAELNAIKEEFPDQVVEYHGKIGITEREANIQRFRDEKHLSIVATVQAMQTGLTLTEATMEIFYSLPLSYTDFIQSEARAYRIGQDKKVLVLLLISKGTVDVDILSALMEKKDVHEYVMEQPQSRMFGGISNE